MFAWCALANLVEGNGIAEQGEGAVFEINAAAAAVAAVAAVAAAGAGVAAGAAGGVVGLAAEAALAAPAADGLVAVDSRFRDGDRAVVVGEESAALALAAVAAVAAGAAGGVVGLAALAAVAALAADGLVLVVDSRLRDGDGGTGGEQSATLAGPAVAAGATNARGFISGQAALSAVVAHAALGL